MYVNVGDQPRPVPEGTEVSEEAKAVQNLGADSTLEEVDEQEGNTQISGSEYYNVSNFKLPEGGVDVSELPGIIEKIKNQPGGFETEYKV